MRPAIPSSCRAVLGGAVEAALLSRAEAVAGAAPVHTGRFSGLGPNGHDPVAHVALGEPAEGSRRLA